MKVYIAGPITGLFNYKDNFKKAERKIKEMGHIALNPSFLPSGLNNYMPICKAMIDQSDMVYFIKGSENSVGAKEEFQHALKAGLPLIFEDKETSNIMFLSQ